MMIIHIIVTVDPAIPDDSAVLDDFLYTPK